MKNNRKMKLNNNYIPVETKVGDEIRNNGIFQFNIFKILQSIKNKEIQVETETINIKEWFRTHLHGKINEDHLPNANI